MPSRRIRKTGLPPGSLIFTGVQKSDVVVKQIVRYNATELDEIDSAVVPEADPNYFYWLDVRGLHSPPEIEAIGNAFGLDPLLLEDILDTSQRPKCELTDQGIFMIMTYLQRRDDSKEFVTEQISMYLTEGRLITFQEYPDDTFQSIRVRMQKPGSRLRSRKPDYLMYAIIDFVSDHYFLVTDHCSDRIHMLDEAINNNPEDDLKKTIYNVRQDISELHRIVMPSREAISTLQRIESPLITEKTRRYLRDAMDNIMQVLDLNDNQADHLASLHDLFMSEMTYRMTNVMKTLTVVTTIFIPLTFITSIYGMNFQNMPELSTKWAYSALWIVMILVAVAQFMFFKRKNWL